MGLGEVFVFVFFGLVATAGTTFALAEDVTALSIVMGCGAGALACALLVVNNLRDIPTDAVAGKKTLAVRLGDRRARMLYVVLVASAFVAIALAALVRPAVLIALAAVAVGIVPIRTIRSGAAGRALVPVLGGTGRLQLAYGALATIGLILSA
jgi:1,4-dihydroxy-2-naphthoate octaprenyltransferase